MADIAKIVDWLVNGTDDVISTDQLAKKLEKSHRTGTPLVVKLGVDPSAPDIHFGHTVVMEKLRQFQELGHQVVFLIGDMTGRIGDPTDRAATRKQLSAEDVKQFAQTYIEQAGKILDANSLIVRYNSEWLGTMDLAGLIQLMGHLTVARVLERDDFHKRYTSHVAIHLHELMYPLMQAYDSVALRADVELGGTDQRFNIMTARQIQEAYGQEPEVGMFMPILEGTDGVRRMGKSLGNYIGVQEAPEEMYGKVMSIPDGLIVRWSQLLLGRDPQKVQTAINQGNPRDAKAELAYQLVMRFWGREFAEKAANHFDQVFRQHEVPPDAPTIAVPTSEGMTALELMALVPDMPSRQEARRLLQQQAVTFSGRRLAMGDTISIQPGDWLKVGKRRYYWVSPKE